MTVDVLIPVYKPDRVFARLLQMLQQQTRKPDRIIVVNTEKEYWNPEGYQGIPGLKVYHVKKRNLTMAAREIWQPGIRMQIL